MPVRLVRPYNGQNANTLYVGTDEAILRAIGIADDYIELASNYVAPSIPFVAQSFRAFASTFSAVAPAGSFITSLSNPFASQGRGITTYTLTGTVPGQIALSASGRSLIVGASAAVAGTVYTVNVTATSGDGLITTQPVTLNFRAVAQLATAGGNGGNPSPTPTPTPGAAFTVTDFVANTIYQRQTLTGGGQGKGTGTIPVQVNVTSIGSPYVRIRASDGVTILQAPRVLPSFANTGVQTLNVTGVDARLAWFYVDLSADGITWKNGTALVAMGGNDVASGQSQAVRQFAKMPAYTGTNASLGVTIEPNSAVYARYTDSGRTLSTPAWAIPADGSNYDSTFAAEFLRRRAASTGVTRGLIGHAVGATAIAAWQPGQQNHTDLMAVLDAVGGFESFYWHQGGDDAGAGTSAAAYQAGLTALFTSLSAHNAARGSSFERYVTAMATRTSAGAGSTAAVQTIRKAALDWAASNSATYLEPHDVTLEDTVHQGQPGNIVLARHLHRATTAATDNGPTIVSGTRSGTAITLTTSSAVSVLGTPTDRFTIYNSGTSASALAVSSLSASGTTITVNLSADPGAAQALDVYWLRHPDPSGTTAAANMIYDMYTADGLPNGRQLQPNLSGAVVVPGGTPTPTPTPTPSSFSDTFTDADGTAITAHTSDTGQSWTNILSANVINTNAVAMTTGTTSTASYSSFAPASADYTVKGQLKFVSTVTGFACWVLGRASAVSTTRTHYQAGYQLAGPSGEGIYLGKTVSGTFTVIGFSAYTLTGAASPEVGLVMSGSSISVTLDGATVIAAVTDTAITAAGTIGVRFACTGTGGPTVGVRIDNLTVA